MKMKLTPAQKSKEWRKNNPDKVISYREKNKQKSRRQSKMYWENNKEEVKQMGLNWRKRNRKEEVARWVKYCKNNPEKSKEITRKSIENNIKNIRERRKILHNEKNFDGLRFKALKRDNYTCQDCGITQEEHLQKHGCSLIVHHKDGVGRDTEKPNNVLDNLQTLCKKCHGKIHGKVKKNKLNKLDSFHK